MIAAGYCPAIISGAQVAYPGSTQRTTCPDLTARSPRKMSPDKARTAARRILPPASWRVLHPLARFPFLAMLFLAGSTSAADLSCVVRQFVGAFNDHDVDAMLAMAADDVRWMSVSGDDITVEAAGADQLRASMTSYFDSIPSARARLRSVHASGPFIHAVEEAVWLSGDTEMSQCSMAIYEIVDGKVKNVWYFSAYECP